MFYKSNYFKTNRSKFFKSLVVVLTLVLFVMPKTSHAILSWEYITKYFDPDRYCNPTTVIFENIARDQPQQSIVRFGYNYDTVRFLKVFYNVFGVSPDNAIRCLTTVPLTDWSPIGGLCEVLTGAPAEADCTNFILGYNGDPNNSSSFASSQVNGSLLGLLYTVDNGVNNLGNPFDLNYFADKTFEKVPFVGEALAAPNDYRAPFVENIYWAWVMVRNLCLGVLALLLLVVGIMMINRTVMPDRSIITIQYALPKIIISIILIAFSYPIGGVMATTFYNIRGALVGQVLQEGNKNILAMYKNENGNIRWGLIFVQILLSVFSVFGVGILGLIIVLIIGVLIIIQLILCLVRQAIYYIKILFEIILSPVSFVYSAIPGNDDKIMAWFKKIVAYGLSMCALGVLPFLVIYIAVSVAASFEPDTVLEVGLATVLNGVAILPFVLSIMIIYTGLSMTLKMPAQIEEVLIGKKKR